MGIKVNQYDTIRDAKGQRYRITEISESLGACKARKVGIDGQVVSKGRERTIMLDDIDGRKYTRVNLAPVQVTKQEPRPDLVRKPQEPKKAPVEELSIKDEKAPQIEKDEPSKDEPKAHTLEDTFEEFREKNQSNVKNVTVTVDGREIREQITHEKELDVLKAELKEKLQEGIDLKERLASSIKEREKADRTVAEQRKTISKMHDQITNTGEVLNDSKRECLELRKMISEMQREHEAEVRALGDELMEAKAEADMMKESKEEALSKCNCTVGMLDGDAAAYLTANELDIAMSYIDGAMMDPRNEKCGMTQAIAALDVILTLAIGRTK